MKCTCITWNNFMGNILGDLEVDLNGFLKKFPIYDFLFFKILTLLYNLLSISI